MKLDLAKVVLPYLPRTVVNCELKRIEAADDTGKWYLRYRNSRLNDEYRLLTGWVAQANGSSKLIVQGCVEDVIPLAGQEALEIVLPQLDAILQIYSVRKRLTLVEGKHMLHVRSLLTTTFTLAQTTALIAQEAAAASDLMTRLGKMAEQISHDGEHLMRYKDWLRRRRMH